MSDWTANIFSFFHTNVEIKRELRYCDGFKCKSIYFIPQGRRQASWSLCPVSGCCLYGLLDSEGQFTGDNIAWVYPDNKTALQGRFINGKMVEASPATVRNRKTTSHNSSKNLMLPFSSYKHVTPKGLLTLRFVREEGEKLRYSPSSPTQLGEQNLIKDQYEDSMTFLSESLIPGAEEGLFCRHDVTKETLLSFYHGLNVPYDYCDYTQELHAFDEEKKILNNVYKIMIESNDTYYIDLPLEVGRNTSLYRASLGHKVNHSFQPNCRYRRMQHPRWGEIVGIFSSRDMKAGEELLCNYGYEVDKCLVPAWYRDLWQRERGGDRGTGHHQG